MAEIKKEENFKEILKRSKEVVGYIYPVVIDKKTLEIVDGKHRKEADPKWPEVQVEFNSKKEKLLYRIHANLMRRQVSRKERAAQLYELALYLEDEGVPTEQIAQEIVKLVPELSPGYIMNLLPAKYKSKKKREAGAKGAKVRREKLRNSALQSTETLIPKTSSNEGSAAMPEKLGLSSISTSTVNSLFEDPAKSLETPKTSKSRPKIPRILICPRCRVEIRTVYCTKCFSELEVREIARILKKEMLEASE